MQNYDFLLNVRTAIYLKKSQQQTGKRPKAITVTDDRPAFKGHHE